MNFDQEDCGVCNVPTNMFERAKGRFAFVLSCLWSNPSINAVGVTPNALAEIAKYTGLTKDEVAAAFEQLESTREVVIDGATGEAVIPQWLEFNYLQERTSAEKPEDVLRALDVCLSPKLKALLVKEISRLDVQFDASQRS